jgi:hypothetical protein
MRKGILAVLFASLSVFVIPLAAAPGLSIEARGGAGITLGTSSDPNSTGSADLAAGGGLVLDYYAFSFGSFSLGLSVGAEYAMLNFHGVTSNYLASLVVPPGVTIPPGITQTSDTTYNYILIPVAIVGHFQLPAGTGLTLRAGGFAGYFLGGQSKESYNSLGQLYGFTNGTSTLDTGNTAQWEYGLHLSGGPDFKLGSRFTFSPSLEFNMGLSNAIVPVPLYNPWNVTFWSLVCNVGFKYDLL